MLTLTEQQFSHFNRVAEQRFDALLLQSIDSLVPEAYRDAAPEARRARLAAAIDVACERGCRWGAEEESDVAVLAALQIYGSVLPRDAARRLGERVTPLLERPCEPGSGHVKVGLIEAVIARDARVDPGAARLMRIVANLRGTFP